MAFPAMVYRRKRWDLIGTSTVCSYSGRWYVINAGHTVERAMAAHLNIYMRIPNGKPYEISEETRFLNDTNMDIAISPVRDADKDDFLEGGIVPLDLNSLYMRQFDLSHLIFFGYPCSQYQPRANNPRTNFIRYTTDNIVPPFPPDIAGKLDPTYHIVGKRTTEPVERIIESETPTMAHLPSFKGMSGGPVFILNLHELSERARPICYFAGIGIESHEGGGFVVALHARAILAALVKFKETALG